jgi:hypothetical protein
MRVPTRRRRRRASAAQVGLGSPHGGGSGKEKGRKVARRAKSWRGLGGERRGVREDALNRGEAAGARGRARPSGSPSAVTTPPTSGCRPRRATGARTAVRMPGHLQCRRKGRAQSSSSACSSGELQSRLVLIDKRLGRLRGDRPSSSCRLRMPQHKLRALRVTTSCKHLRRTIEQERLPPSSAVRRPNGRERVKGAAPSRAVCDSAAEGASN